VAIRSDAGDLAEIESLARTIAELFGNLDILFLNAGIALYGKLASATTAGFDEAFAVNAKAVLFYTQYFAPLMNRGGSIIVTTSINSRIGMMQTHIYAASKAAAGSLVRTLAGELAAQGLRVNALSPGPVSTEVGGKTGLSAAELQAVKDSVIAKVPMHRFASPEELAGAALFLASADSSFVTGQEIVVDGGWIGVG
jgi:NAD(P)-dependent dehydrogenase (short-subunit alcohol dehydrogenase family)